MIFLFFALCKWFGVLIFCFLLLLTTKLLVKILELLYKIPPHRFDLKIVYSYVIEGGDSEFDIGLHG